MKRIPKYKQIVYRLNDNTGYYETHSAPPGFGKLPHELKVEDTQRPEIIRAKQIIRGRLKNGRYPFITGLRQTPAGQWYSGDHKEVYKGKPAKSLILFNFSPDNQMLNVYFFPGYIKYDQKRLNKFVEGFTESLKMPVS